VLRLDPSQARVYLLVAMVLDGCVGLKGFGDGGDPGVFPIRVGAVSFWGRRGD